MSISAAVTIWCDRCGGPAIRREILVPEKLGIAKGKTERLAREGGWDISNGKHICPCCKRGSVGWTAKANPDHVARLEGG